MSDINTIDFKNWLEQLREPVKSKIKTAVMQASNQPGTSSREAAKKVLHQSQQDAAADPHASVSDLVDIATVSDKLKASSPKGLNISRSQDRMRMKKKMRR